MTFKELFELPNTVFHCKTEIEANRLLHIGRKLGYKWCNGRPLFKDHLFSDYKENTCYNINKGEYCDLEWYKTYNIIEFSELNLIKMPIILKRK